MIGRLRTLWQWWSAQSPAHRRWIAFSAIVALAIPAYHLFDYLDERLQAPYKRYEPLCWWPTGGIRTVSGSLKPEFYHAVLPRLRPYLFSDLAGGSDYVIYIKRRMSRDDEEWIWMNTTKAAYEVLRKEWGMSLLAPYTEVEERLKKLPGFFQNKLTCEGLRKIAIQP